MVSKTLVFALVLSAALTRVSLADATRRPPPGGTAGLTGVDLTRIHVGNQAGVLKVYAADHHGVKFLKGSSWSDVSGIDGVKWAPVTPTDRDGILEALGIAKDPAKIDRNLLTRYGQLPQVEAVALLGVLAAPGNVTRPLPVSQERATLHFLEHLVDAEPLPKARRQAVLALAIQPEVHASAVEPVLRFLKHDHNIWDTFTTVQFFEYHRAQVAAMADHERISKAVEQSGNPHAEDILRILTEPPNADADKKQDGP